MAYSPTNWHGRPIWPWSRHRRWLPGRIDPGGSGVPPARSRYRHLLAGSCRVNPVPPAIRDQEALVNRDSASIRRLGMATMSEFQWNQKLQNTIDEQKLRLAVLWCLSDIWHIFMKSLDFCVREISLEFKPRDEFAHLRYCYGDVRTYWRSAGTIKHETLNQCRVNVGPASATLAQH